jgi:hypothetical protein
MIKRATLSLIIDKDNILFNLPLDEERYQMTLEVKYGLWHALVSLRHRLTVALGMRIG